MAELAYEQFDLRNLAHDHLVTLSQLSGHTVHLAAIEGDDIVYVDKVDPIGGLRLYSQIGKPDHGGSCCETSWTPPDLDEARRWYQQAAEAGNTFAAWLLGRLSADKLDPPTWKEPPTGTSRPPKPATSTGLRTRGPATKTSSGSPPAMSTPTAQ